MDAENIRTMLRRIYLRSAIAAGAAGVLGFFASGWKTGLGIICGGAIMALNLKGLSWGLGGLLGADGARPRILIMSFLRLILVFIALGALIALKAVSALGLAVGIGLVLATMLAEGFSLSKTMENG